MMGSRLTQIITSVFRYSSVILFSLSCARLVPNDDAATAETTPSSTATEGATESTQSTDEEAESVEDQLLIRDVGGEACDVLLQDCGAGYKCVPDELLAHSCAPILGSKQVGEHCTLDWGVPAIDDCDATSFCWDDACTPLCQGQTEATATCPAGFHCLMSSNFLGLCFGEPCNPLMPVPCPFNWICVASVVNGSASCDFTNAEHGVGQLGDPCDDPIDCVEGLTCWFGEELLDCVGENCCTAWCDLQDIMSCASQPGSECVAVGIGGYGVCRSP
jgi:hypothetical protein